VNVAEQIDAAATATIPDEPYPGLRSFRRDETHIFFGREDTINEMVNRLAAHRFLAVTGTSGSGKSSLVRTGLLDALSRGLLAEAGSDWRVADFRPGGRPFEELTGTLIDAVGGARSAHERVLIEARLARGPSSLADWLDEIGFPADSNLLLLVDQFEELFRYREGTAADAADAFVALLLAAARQRARRIYVVMTMRSDFLGECAQFPGLAETINDGQFLTPRLTRAQCEQAIEGPATVFGGRVEKALVNRLLNDMGSNPDQLPLMQHVLMLMWRNASARSPDAPVLTLAEYEALGGISSDPRDRDDDQTPANRQSDGALSNHADEILARLTPEQQRLAQVLFRALTHSEGGTGRDVRRPIRLADAAAIAEVPPADLVPVIEAFRAPGRHFLTPAPPHPLAPDTIIDISHESLIRQWASLRRWVREEFGSAERYRNLEGNARIWEKGEAGLLSMPYLGVTLAWREREHPNPAWAARYGHAFALAMKYLDASSRRHRRRRFWRQALVFGSLAVIAIVAAGVAAQYMSARRASTFLLQIDLSEELPDFKVPPQDTLQVNVGTETPLSVPGGSRILTPDLRALLAGNKPVVMVDALYDKHEATISGAVRISRAGNAGSFQDYDQYQLARVLKVLTGNNPDTPLVFFCVGMRCWESYNACLRALRLGYTQISWYRGGLNAWIKAKLPTEGIFDRTHGIEARLAKETDAAQRRRLAVELDEIVAVLIQHENPSEALTAAKQSHEVLQGIAASAPDDMDVQWDLAVSARRMAEAFKASHDPGSAIAAYRDGLAIATPAGGKRPDDAGLWWEIAFLHGELGDALKGQNDLAGALGAYREKRAIFERLSAKDPDNATWRGGVGWTTHQIGEVLRAQQDLKAALEAYRAEAAIYEALSAKGTTWDGDLVRSHFYVGFVLLQLGDPAGALASFREALPHARALVVKNPNGTDTQEDVAVIEEHIADILRAQDDPAAALVSYRDALVVRRALAEKNAASDPAQTALASVYGRIGAVLAVSGMADGALEAYRNAAAISRKLAAAHRDNAAMAHQLALDHMNIGIVELALDQVQAAGDDLATAVQIDPAYPYAVLSLQIARLRAGRTESDELKANSEKLDHGKWPWPIVAFFLGQSGRDALRATAEGSDNKTVRRDQVCETDYHLGMHDLATGDRSGARQLLESAARNCSRTFTEYWSAKLQLARMP
jgi:lipoprotein NlpI/rhodanese-related sulfurtransferase